MAARGARSAGWPRAADWVTGSLRRNAITTAPREGLAKLGWVEGRNLKIERRFGAGDANRLQKREAGRRIAPGWKTSDVGVHRGNCAENESMRANLMHGAAAFSAVC